MKVRDPPESGQFAEIGVTRSPDLNSRSRSRAGLKRESKQSMLKHWREADGGGGADKKESAVSAGGKATSEG